MAELAIIGGTGLTTLRNLEIDHREVVHTPYGEPSGPLTFGKIRGKEIIFLARHGSGHTIPPHKINYRANLWALKEAGASRVIAVGAVGGIHPDMSPGQLVFPDQIIDYTWSRYKTFHEEDLDHVVHIDFTRPYCEDLRALLIKGAQSAGQDALETGTYGATQGPRLETAAEIDRLERDGCDMVGMTGMPEAALARELDLCYATCAVISNMAAGRGEDKILMEDLTGNLGVGMNRVRTLLEEIIPGL